MRDRLTLKAGTHRTAKQAADPEDQHSQITGQRQPRELQTAFLAGILNQTVTVYLVSGVKLTGKVRQHDQYTLLLQGADGIDSLIFKHAISTLIPGVPVVPRERRTLFGKKPEWTANSR